MLMSVTSIRVSFSDHFVMLKFIQWVFAYVDESNCLFVCTETCLDKTPKRELNSRSYLHAFRSPANETDLQLEIFWDPHSPLALKLGNYLS